MAIHPSFFNLRSPFAFPKKVFSAIYTLTYLVWYISVAGGSVGISCCCRQLADGLAQYIYPHKFCIAHGLRLLFRRYIFGLIFLPWSTSYNSAIFELKVPVCVIYKISFYLSSQFSLIYLFLFAPRTRFCCHFSFSWRFLFEGSYV